MIRRWLSRLAMLLLLAGLAVGGWYLAKGPAIPDAITGETPRVRDGDTLTLSGKTIRLAGIDAPEYHQLCATAAGVRWPCGKAARSQLEAFALTGPITCHSAAHDRYGRDVAMCGTPAVPDFGAAMVRAGMAVSLEERGDAPYPREQADAQSARRGVWQGRFQTPADWRRDNPRSTGTAANSVRQ